MRLVLASIILTVTFNIYSQELEFNNTEDTIEFIKSVNEKLNKRNQKLKGILGKGTNHPSYYRDLLLKDKKKIARIIKERKDIGFALKGALSELEAYRHVLSRLELKASKLWANKFSERLEGNQGLVKGNIYDLNFSSSKLGVILDNSNSMKSHLPKIKNEIKKNFKNAIIRTVNGVALRNYEKNAIDFVMGQNEWFYLDDNLKGLNPFRADIHIQKIPTYAYINGFYQFCSLDNLSAFKALINIYKVDSLFWFSDFQDEIHDDVYNELKNLLKKNVTLYIQTTEDAKIPAKIHDLITLTKGKILQTKF